MHVDPSLVGVRSRSELRRSSVAQKPVPRVAHPAAGRARSVISKKSSTRSPKVAMRASCTRTPASRKALRDVARAGRGDRAQPAPAAYAPRGRIAGNRCVAALVEMLQRDAAGRAATAAPARRPAQRARQRDDARRCATCAHRSPRMPSASSTMKTSSAHAAARGHDARFQHVDSRERSSAATTAANTPSRSGAQTKTSVPPRDACGMDQRSRSCAPSRMQQMRPPARRSARRDGAGRRSSGKSPRRGARHRRASRSRSRSSARVSRGRAHARRGMRRAAPGRRAARSARRRTDRPAGDPSRHSTISGWCPRCRRWSAGTDDPAVPSRRPARRSDAPRRDR